LFLLFPVSQRQSCNGMLLKLLIMPKIFLAQRPLSVRLI
jgi:hypothetical protein